MSDPKNPGMTQPGAEPDTTMIRPAGDFGGSDQGQSGHRADRVRDWMKRNTNSSRKRLPGASGPADLAAPSGSGEADGGTPSTAAPKGGFGTGPTGSSNPGLGTAPAVEPGQQVFRPGAPSGPEQSDNDTTVLNPRGGTNAPPAETDVNETRVTRGFMDKVKDRARTVSTGVAGAAAGAMGTREPTGAAAAAVPPPENAEDTGSLRRAGVARRTRKARLRLSQVDPWSVMKTAFLFAVAAGIVLWVATGTIWAVISASGMFEEINRIIGDIVQTPGDDTPFRIQDYINTSKVMGTAALVAVIDVVIFTALATLGAFLYNLASAMIGGLEVTLAED